MAVDGNSYRITKSLLQKLENDKRINMMHGNVSFQTINNVNNLKNKINILGNKNCISIDDNLVIAIERHVETCKYDELYDLEGRSFFRITKLDEDKSTGTIKFTRTHNVIIMSDKQFIIDDLSVDMPYDKYNFEVSGLFADLRLPH